jgi:hypothetical protein
MQAKCCGGEDELIRGRVNRYSQLQTICGISYSSHSLIKLVKLLCVFFTLYNVYFLHYYNV